jgi:hypothetical protein
MTLTVTVSASAPRTKPHASAPGSYEVAVKIAKPLITPGELLEVDLFFSGYGEILQPKIFFFPSARVFDVSKSSIRSGLHRDEDGSIKWGGQISKISAVDPVHIGIMGLEYGNWAEPTAFFDADDNGNSVFTEYLTDGHAPISLSFQTNNAVEPGKYYIELTFTYFDGQKWRSSLKRIEFTLTSFLERHQRKLAWYGVTVSAIGLAIAIIRFFK